MAARPRPLVRLGALAPRPPPPSRRLDLAGIDWVPHAPLPSPALLIIKPRHSRPFGSMKYRRTGVSRDCVQICRWRSTAVALVGLEGKEREQVRRRGSGGVHERASCEAGWHALVARLRARRPGSCGCGGWRDGCQLASSNLERGRVQDLQKGCELISRWSLGGCCRQRRRRAREGASGGGGETPNRRRGHEERLAIGHGTCKAPVHLAGRKCAGIVDRLGQQEP